MKTWMNLKTLSAEVERIAQTSSEDGMARLTRPGAEGLQVFFASVSDDNTISVEDNQKGYHANSWSQDRSLMWEEIESMVVYGLTH